MSSSVIGVTIVALWLSWARAEVFTSIADVEPLLATQQDVIDQLERYLAAENEKINILSRHLNRFKRELGKMRQEEDYVGNPINAFTLIKRLTADLETIEYYTKVQHPFERKPGLIYPEKEDLDGAAMALWRLQRMYAQNVSMLAAGVLQGNYSHNKEQYVETTSSMSISDCFEVGRVIYDQQDYQSAVYWMQEALKKYSNKDPDEFHFFDGSYIIDYLRNAYHGVGNFDKAIEYTNMLAKLRPDKDYSESIKEYKELAKQDNSQMTFYADQDIAFLTPEAKDRYRALCRGDIPFPEDKRKSLYCYFKRQPAFLQLAPVKVELLHQDPEVYLFHEVISDAEIEHLQEISLPNLRRATVNDEGTIIAAQYRISKTAWFSDENSTVAARISRLVEDISELSMTTAEALQVANYGIGGHYDPHFDFLSVSEQIVASSFMDEFGNRISTFLFYMSDVEQGGATVFMDLNVTVYPVKNSALMWMNLLPSGEPDYRTNHAACPVLRGSKWVSNKWLHVHDQEFKRPCSLEFQENKSMFNYA